MKKRILLLIIVSLIFINCIEAKSSDFNQDRVVNFDDFFLFSDNFGKQVTKTNSQFDLDNNNKINIEDFFIFADDFGKKTIPSQKPITSSQIEICPDFNNDNKVNYDDFFLFVDEYGKRVNKDNDKLDLDNNNKIDIEDFFIFADYFGKECKGKWDFEESIAPYFDKLTSSITGPCLRFTGDRDMFLERKSISTTLNIVGTSYSKTFQQLISTSSLELRGKDCKSYGRISLDTDQESHISEVYPDGNVEIELTIIINGRDLSGDETIYKGNHIVKFVPYKDNYEYKIGIVQGVSPGYDLESKNYCLYLTRADKRKIPQKIMENCEDGLSYNYVEILETIRVVDLLGYDQLYKRIDDLYGWHTDYVDIYSLSQVGNFWLNLLDKHNIRDLTRLKRNPSFKVELLGPFKNEPNFTFNDGAKVEQFFKEIVDKNSVDIDQYDFIVYVYYSDDRAFRGFQEQGSYISYPISELLINEGFKTVAHELGHYFLSQRDLYEGWPPKYPEGVPDPNPLNFPQEYTCIMAKSKGLELNEDQTSISSSTQQISPDNFVMCAESIVKAIGYENHNCPLADFYAGNCGDCTSLNYLSCQK